jgi:hypothetical protein
MTAITETEVVQACETLFGSTININKDFLHLMQPSGVKSAYRKKAKEHHPDLFATNPIHIQQRQTAVFQQILRAYDVLNHYFKQREDGSWNPAGNDSRSPIRNRKNSTPEPSYGQSAGRKGDDSFYNGDVPFETLQIGQYLYYRGKITFETLINALVWQRKQRPSIGDIALQWGWLDSEGLSKVSRSCERPRLFGEKAVEMGMLTIFQVNTILLYQSSLQDRLGNYFVLNRLLSQEELEHLARELKDHNAGVLSCTVNRAQKQRTCA